jgi:hypothetical protein
LIDISKNLDGKSFTLFVKHLNELRTDVLEQPNHKLKPDSFMIFIDKMAVLTHSKELNNMILNKMSEINIDELKTKKILNTY